VGDFRIFTIRSDRKRSPRTGQEHDFYVIEAGTWVNVIALTPANELVMVEQFRHGTDTVELEIPGGMMDPQDTSPVSAGQRELREETGYVGRDACTIGENYPNPAIMNNVCLTVLVRDCELRGEVELDHTEDMVTRLVALEEVPHLVAAGAIRHALVLVALYHLELWRRLPTRRDS
jgi:8-oxo-dGTP pyrophosphatase MutT (NUDIX family)